MQDIDALVAELKARVLDLGISVQAVSRLAGLGLNTLKHLKKHGWAPTPTTIRALQKVILHLESLSQESLIELAKEKKIHPPRVVEQKALTKTSNIPQTMKKLRKKQNTRKAS